MLEREQAQVALCTSQRTPETRVLPGEEQNRHQAKYRRRNKKTGQRSNNNALGLEEKSSKAWHSPAVLINLINKSRQAYESFMTSH